MFKYCSPSLPSLAQILPRSLKGSCIVSQARWRNGYTLSHHIPTVFLNLSCLLTQAFPGRGTNGPDCNRAAHVVCWPIRIRTTELGPWKKSLSLSKMRQKLVNMDSGRSSSRIWQCYPSPSSPSAQKVSLGSFCHEGRACEHVSSSSMWRTREQFGWELLLKLGWATPANLALKWITKCLCAPFFSLCSARCISSLGLIKVFKFFIQLLRELFLQEQTLEIKGIEMWGRSFYLWQQGEKTWPI